MLNFIGTIIISSAPNTFHKYSRPSRSLVAAAVTLGTLSANGSPLQLIHAGVGSAAVQHLPWSLIPTVLVPAYLILHGIIFAQLRARSAERAGNPAARAA
jgi:hypothetical protein